MGFSFSTCHALSGLVLIRTTDGSAKPGPRRLAVIMELNGVDAIIEGMRRQAGLAVNTVSLLMQVYNHVLASVHCTCILGGEVLS